MSKNKKIELNFCGNNSCDVTGSMLHIKTPDIQILVDCGIVQSGKANSTLEMYKENTKKFGFKPKELDYVFITHSHGDHINLAPRLYKEGCTAPLIMAENSKLFAEILMNDSVNIMKNDAEELSKKFSRSYAPIYSQDDVDNCLSHYVEYPTSEIIVLNEFLKFRFVPAGHLLTSTQVELWITCGNLTKKIVVTGDLGNTNIERPYINKFEPVTKCDIFVAETTYAKDQLHIADTKARQKDIEKLKAVIEQTCIEDKGRVLIPVFAQDRGQTMLTELYKIFGKDKWFDVPVIIDSPMFSKCNEAYTSLLTGDDAKLWKDVMSWENVFQTKDYIESREWRESNKPVVVLSSSGMLVGKGRSIAWGCSVVPREKDRIIFCGYAAEGSLADILKQGKQKTIVISGKKCKNKCQITNLTSFSSHIQYNSMLDYYSNVDCEKIILVHGDEKAKIDFAKVLQEQISKKDKTSKVVCATKDYRLSI